MPSSADPTKYASLERAEAEAGNYEWVAAATTYAEALNHVEAVSDPETVTQLTEQLAKCHFKSAFQLKNRGEFRERMELARACYRDAISLHEKIGYGGLGKMAKARESFAEFWLSENSENRRILIEKCIRLSLEAVATFSKPGDSRHLAKAHSELLNYYLESLHLLTDGKSLAERFDQAVNLGRKTVLEWEAIKGGEELIEVLHLTLWMLTVLAQVLLAPPGFAGLAEETARLESKMLHLSEELGTPYSDCLSKETAGNVAFAGIGDPAKAFALYKEGLSRAKVTADSLATGRLLAFMALAELWRSVGEEYAEQRKDALENGLKLGEDAVKNLEVPFHTSYLVTACDAIANCHIDLATYVETDAEMKRSQLIRALEVSRSALSFETHTWGWQRIAHSLSKAMYFLAILEPDPQRKRKLLEDSLGIRQETVRVTDSVAPNSWSAGVMRNYLALIKAEMAGLETDTRTKENLLMGAVSDMRQCMDNCSKWAALSGFARNLAEYAEWYGDVLFRLYSLTADLGSARHATELYNDAIGYLTKSGGTILIAALNWKIGRVYDTIEDFDEASNAFRKAAENYRLGAKSIPELAPSFEELGNYMEAWSSIQKARVHHAREEYTEAKEHYVQAAKNLQETRKWRYLSVICVARSFLEKGEGLSRQEKHDASIEAFNKALEGFRTSETELAKKLKESDDGGEKNELSHWIKIVSQRQKFSLGRAEVEQGKIFDRRGQKMASSRRYLAAAESFKSIALEIDNVEDKREMVTFARFCEAWARMKEAESKVSPEMYAEAAESFLKTREIASQERLRLLALANASICKALEFGTRFHLTRDPQLYPDIKRQLETAADYYQEAGLRKTAGWTQGTKRLFDALVFISDAEVERDPKKKAELFHAAEKHLELAARLFGEAGFPAKKVEALGHLGRVREEKQVLLAPLEALSQIPMATGAAIGLIPGGRGQPLGVERFEEANVVGHLTVPERELKAGSDFAFEIEIANAGRATATLVRLENVVPEGFEIEREKNPYRIEDHSIDLRGRRLEHLKMDEMKIVLRPVQKGTFQLRPRAVFADDRGNYRQLEFEPVEVRVGELGFSGWLRGPGKRVQPREKPLEMVATSQASLTSRFEGVPPIVRVPPEFKFETERAREVFRALVKAFVSDYVVKRLFVEKAGWRSLMDLVREMKIPRSAVYAPGGRDGPVLEELEQRGLVEARIFPKERGRGGDIKKVRVAYDNEIVKRIVEQTVIKDK